MTPSSQSDNTTRQLDQLRSAAQQRAEIDTALNGLFAPEDDALRAALTAGREADMPAIQISPLQGRLLQVLATACGARKILEIGALAGYSSIWLARALPSDGRLISLEMSEKHAGVARASLSRAGLSDRAEVRVGPAIEALPTLVDEAPFDLVFIDADKPGYPAYLDWALKLTRPGSIIVADNCIRGARHYESRPVTIPTHRPSATMIGVSRQTHGCDLSLSPWMTRGQTALRSRWCWPAYPLTTMAERNG